MNKINLTTDYIYNENVSKEIKIIHISDIHFSIKTKLTELDKLSNYIKEINPDYIMITGDIIDESSITKDDKINELFIFLNDLAKISKVLICLGNHDVYHSNDFIFFDKVNKINNIEVLNNRSYLDKYIHVLGITLPNEYYSNSKNESSDIFIDFLDKNKELIDHNTKNIPNILLVHSPIKLTDNKVLKRLKKYDLILCGHTHNGMVPKGLSFLFPKNMGIISPHKVIFPEIAKGKIIKKIDNKEITIIINGAITKLSNRSGINNLNFIYNKDINEIILTKKRGKIYE